MSIQKCTSYVWGGYGPEPYTVAGYERAWNHKWYMTDRQICIYDLYFFEPEILVEWNEFEDVLGRGFRQPTEGLSKDNTSTSHMLRTLRRPSKAL